MIKKKSKNTDIPVNKVDNSSLIDAYVGSIDRAAAGYAEKYARTNKMKIVNCPGFDWGMRVLATALAKNNIIPCEDLLNFLKKHSYKTNFADTESAWWNDNS